MSKFIAIAVLCLGIGAQAGVLRVTSTATVGAGDDLVFFTGSYNYEIAILPSCGPANDGEKHTFKGIDNTHCAQAHAAGSDTINGGVADTVCASQADQVVCDGSNHQWVSVGYW